MNPIAPLSPPRPSLRARITAPPPTPHWSIADPATWLAVASVISSVLFSGFGIADPSGYVRLGVLIVTGLLLGGIALAKHLLSFQGLLAALIQVFEGWTPTAAPTTGNTAASVKVKWVQPIQPTQLPLSRPVRLIARRPSYYGCVPDLPDARDLRLAFSTDNLPPSVDLRTDPRMPAVWAQGQLGSCTAHGIGAALIFHEVVETMPSRLFIYYNERAIEGTTASDSGAQIRDGIKSVASQGACPETLWPYDVSRFTTQPPPECYPAGLADVALSYARVGQDAYQIMAALAAGNLVVIGISIYSSFESSAVAQTGIVPLPDVANEQLLGGHCLAVVGYLTQDGTLYAIVRNSWDVTWGQAGYCLIPMAYLTNPNLASDFWVISNTGAAPEVAA